VSTLVYVNLVQPCCCDSAIESELVKPRAWELQGEVNAKSRPAESLLDARVDFDYAGRPPAPPPTEEETKSLEELIRQRIIDEAWDDPERKNPDDFDDPDDRKAKPMQDVSAEKSQLGLAQLYERDMINKAKQAAGSCIALFSDVQFDHFS